MKFLTLLVVGIASLSANLVLAKEFSPVELYRTPCRSAEVKAFGYCPFTLSLNYHLKNIHKGLNRGFNMMIEESNEIYRKERERVVNLARETGASVDQAYESLDVYINDFVDSELSELSRAKACEPLAVLEVARANIQNEIKGREEILEFYQIPQTQFARAFSLVDQVKTICNDQVFDIQKLFSTYQEIGDSVVTIVNNKLELQMLIEEQVAMILKFRATVDSEEVAREGADFVSAVKNSLAQFEADCKASPKLPPCILIKDRVEDNPAFYLAN